MMKKLQLVETYLHKILINKGKFALDKLKEKKKMNDLKTILIILTNKYIYAEYIYERERERVYRYLFFIVFSRILK